MSIPTQEDTDITIDILTNIYLKNNKEQLIIICLLTIIFSLILMKLTFMI
jgi:hypothetical protein